MRTCLHDASKACTVEHRVGDGLDLVAHLGRHAHLVGDPEEACRHRAEEVGAVKGGEQALVVRKMREHAQLHLHACAQHGVLGVEGTRRGTLSCSAVEGTGRCRALVALARGASRFHLCVVCREEHVASKVVVRGGDCQSEGFKRYSSDTHLPRRARSQAAPQSPCEGRRWPRRRPRAHGCPAADGGARLPSARSKLRAARGRRPLG